MDYNPLNKTEIHESIMIIDKLKSKGEGKTLYYIAECQLKIWEGW